jgi:hypothetical protein
VLHPLFKLKHFHLALVRGASRLLVAINGCKLKFGLVVVQGENQAQITEQQVAVVVVLTTQ